MEVIVRREKYCGCDDGTSVFMTSNPTSDFQSLFRKDLNDYEPPTDDCIEKEDNFYRIISRDNEVICEICEVKDLPTGGSTDGI